MTGQDIQMRSDAQTAQTEAQYAQIGAGFQQQQLDTIRNIPGQLQEIQMRQQMMEQQQMEAAILERQAEADLRMKEVAMNQQLQKSKMNDLLMSDEVQRSRLNVEATALAVKQQRLDVEQKSHALKDRDKSATHDRQMDLLRTMGPAAFARAKGKKFTMEDGRLMFSDPESPEDLDKFIKGLDRGEDPKLQHASRARLMAQSIAAPYTTQFGVEWPDTKKGKADKARYDQIMSGAGAVYEDMYGGGQPTPGTDPGTALEDEFAGPPAPTPQTAPPQPVQVTAGANQEMKLSEGAQRQAGAARWHAQRDPTWGKMAEAMGEASFDRVLAGIGVAADDLVQNDRMPPDRAAQVVMNRILSGGDDAAHYLTMANYSKDQIRTWLLSRPNATLQSVNAIMERTDKHIQSRRSRKK